MYNNKTIKNVVRRPFHLINICLMFNLYNNRHALYKCNDMDLYQTLMTNKTNSMMIFFNISDYSCIQTDIIEKPTHKCKDIIQ